MRQVSLCLVCAAILWIAQPVDRAGALPAGVQMPGIANALEHRVHGRHCEYSFGPKKGKPDYMHRHAWKCNKDAKFRQPTTFSGFADQRQFSPNPSEFRFQKRRRCWRNDWNELTCAGTDF